MTPQRTYLDYLHDIHEAMSTAEASEPRLVVVRPGKVKRKSADGHG